MVWAFSNFVENLRTSISKALSEESVLKDIHIRKNQNLRRLILTILILIISILSYQEVRKHHYGLDTMDFNDNVRKDFNYG